ncbi:Crp/Fnr family transcriptional regulator [Pedobacter sandarakinus]|uniref:Crp/Fnr family transcriptional regulator n=1 Tax=Pedobacter sandarakinus TaxID=353156 RepID=UPI0022476CD2|nr:Crp/Fnr family transcriptional regulator [Pedobacter sandarakinus]MCX2575897.1 Crp/Fnr family transcriptional regulator [Pedobacter sandarakinus]
MIANPKIYTAIKPLISYLTLFNPLSNEFKTYLEEHCQQVNVRKNKYILSPIDNNNSIFFIVKGVARAFVKEDKKDISTRFSFENEFIEAIRNPNEVDIHSIEYLQAIEDCELIRIPYQNNDFIYSHFPESGIIARKLLTLFYHASSERSILSRIPSALGRYNRLLSSSIDISRIPQRYLASYLGIRLETLSRIRNKAIDNRILQMA